MLSTRLSIKAPRRVSVAAVKSYAIKVGDILVGSRKHAVYTLSSAGHDLARAYGYQVVRKIMTDAATLAAWHAQYGVQARPYLEEGV